MKAYFSLRMKVALGVIWSIFVLWKFFHNFPLFNVLEVLQNGFLLLVLLIFFTALGKRVLRFFHVSLASFSEEVSYSFGLGTGIVIFFSHWIGSNRSFISNRYSPCYPFWGRRCLYRNEISLSSEL